MTATSRPASPSSGYAWYVVTVLLLASIIGYIDRLIMGFLVDPINLDMGFSDTRMGMLNGVAFALFYVVMGLPLGRLIDVANSKTVLTICIVIWSSMTMFCGLAKHYLMEPLNKSIQDVSEAAN